MAIDDPGAHGMTGATTPPLLVRFMTHGQSPCPWWPPRICYCPEERRARWRDGARAGPDRAVGTEDDLKLPDDKEGAW